METLMETLMFLGLVVAVANIIGMLIFLLIPD